MRQESIDSSYQEHFLQTIDKIEREKDEVTNEALVKIGTTREAVQNFIDSAADSKHFSSVINNLQARGLSDYVKVDLNVVRGLAYYTGAVFEVFDTNRNMRAIAGGGRYDKLCSLISDGAADISACGFAMGDVVITDLIKQTKSANAKLLNYLGTEDSSDAYIIIADENHRNDALSIAQLLRNNGCRVSYPLAPTKVGKQFGNAENLKSRTAVIIGSEYPKIKVKDLIQREEIEIETDQILKFIKSIKNTPPEGPLLAK
jgi:histidyl-tRNA synthetase